MYRITLKNWFSKEFYGVNIYQYFWCGLEKSGRETVGIKKFRRRLFYW
jgi:hypothetical protein